MSKQQRDAIDEALRAEPFGLNQSTDGHRKTFDAFAIRPYPADVAAAEVTLGGVPAIELTVTGHPADPTVLYFHGGGYVAGSARTGTYLAAELARRAAAAPCPWTTGSPRSTPTRPRCRTAWPPTPRYSNPAPARPGS